MGVTVSQKDIDDRLAQIRKTYYHGSEQKLEAALAKDHLTLDELEQYNLRPTLLSEKLQAKVTSGVKVSKADAQSYYTQNKAAFKTPSTREVRHILVNSKSLADQIETKLKNGAELRRAWRRSTRRTRHPRSRGASSASRTAARAARASRRCRRSTRPRSRSRRTRSRSR